MKNVCDKKITMILIEVALLFIMSNIPVFAATYYIAINGTDSFFCGSATSDCATAQYVLDNKVAAGDTIKVKPGTYSGWSGNFWADINDAVKHQNITITADDPANRPLIQGISGKWGLIWIRNVSGVTISYLKLAHSTGRINQWKNGVIQIKSNPTIIDNNEIYNGFNGISIETGKNVTISNNKIYTHGPLTTCVPYQANGDGGGIGIYKFESSSWTQPATSWSEKIYIYNNEIYDTGADGVINVNTFYKYIEIANNNIHDNYEEGLDWKDTQYVRIHNNQLHDNCGNGIGSNYSYPSNDFEIWANKIYNNNQWGIMIQGSNQSNWKIYNNLIYDNCEFPNYNCSGADLGGTGHEFYFNVVTGHNPTNVQGYSITGSGTKKNNVFYNNGTGAGGGSNGGGGDRNYVYPTTGSVGANAVTSPDPMFLDAAKKNFGLKTGSPLIDKGTNINITTDYAGKPRPKGSGYDIGAYEYDAVGGPVPPAPPQDLMRKTN